MAVNAKFTADFSSFYAAVQKAESQLQGFGSSAKQAASTLSNLTASFSGQKIIQEAHGIEAAVTRIGGASKLTEAEQRRVSGTLSEALAKYKALGLEVPPQMMKLAEATGAIPPKLSAMDKAAQFAKTSFGQMFGAFTLASVATSLLSKLSGEVTRFVSEGLKISAIQQSFDRLAVGLGQDSQKMLTALQTATRGMVSNFDLMQSANKAMLLGLPVTAESMQELAKTATILGKAMGQDATKSFDDLITALGRSSPLILDNLGLTVKVGEANEVYARKLGKTVDQLTDAEKKIAFYNAAMEAARNKTEELGEQTKTLGDLAATAWVKFGNAVSQTTATLNVGIGRAVSSTRDFATFLSDAAFNGFGYATAMARIRTEAEQLAKVKKPDPVASPKDTEETKKYADAVKKTKTETDTYAESVRRLRDQLSGAKLAGDVRLLHDAFMRLTPEQRRNADVMERVGDAARKLHDEGAVLTPVLHQVYLNTTTLLPVTDGLAKGFEQVGTSFKMAYDLGVKLPPVINGISGSIGTVFQVQVPDAVKHTQRWEGSVDELARSFAQLAQISDGTLGTVVRDVGRVIGAWDLAIKSVAAYREAQGAIRKVAGALGVFGAVGSAIGTVVDLFKKLTGPTEYEKRVRAEAAAVKQLMDDAIKAAGSMDKLRMAADLVGIQIDVAFRSRDPKFLQEVLDDVESRTHKLTAAMEEYGFTWEDLGDKARQSKLTEIAQELLEKTQLLMGAGIDHDEILKRQANDYIELIKSAVRTGTEIPASLKAVIDELTKMGLLVDENGNALSELADVKFAETMTEGFRGVRDELKNIADLLRLQIPGAVKSAFDSIPRRVDVELVARKSGDWQSPSDREGFATGTPGLGYVNFGAGTPTWLHGREAVVPESRVGELAEQIAAALGGGGSSSDTPIINVYVGNEALDARTIRVVRSGVAQGLVPISTSSLVRQSSYA